MMFFANEGENLLATLPPPRPNNQAQRTGLPSMTLILPTIAGTGRSAEFGCPVGRFGPANRRAPGAETKGVRGIDRLHERAAVFALTDR